MSIKETMRQEPDLNVCSEEDKQRGIEKYGLETRNASEPAAYYRMNAEQKAIWDAA